ncbi:MAG TPA: hypothetical protein VEI83_02100 [Acidimicrobiales bacterium]|nr:hypothetical protein [Acidimicrobiales bacterium]
MRITATSHARMQPADAGAPPRRRRGPTSSGRVARRWTHWLAAAVTPALLAGAVVLMVSGLAPSDAAATVHRDALATLGAHVPTTTQAVVTPTTVPVTTTVPTTTAPPPPPPPPPPVPTTTVAPASAPASNGVPPEGQATAYGCGPALAYLTAYAAPGFQLVCPGDSQGHQATTCISSYPCAPGQKMIIITDPCPAAYMNEAHNSWAVQDGGSIDPYGYCRS